MTFLEIKDQIKKSYRTPDKIVQEFYIPLLSRAKSYDRAVGFFSSSVLIELSRGLINLVNNGGKMRLITSPRLQEQDIAVRTGLHCAPDSHRFMNTFPTGTVRFSISYFTNNNDLEHLDNALKYISDNS